MTGFVEALKKKAAKGGKENVDNKGKGKAAAAPPNKKTTTKGGAKGGRGQPSCSRKKNTRAAHKASEERVKEADVMAGMLHEEMSFD